MPVPAIILAAGASKRLGQPKQLVELDGETLLNRAIRVARNGGAEPVLVVLGAQFERICVSILASKPVLVHNDQWQSGMASSIVTGLKALSVCARDAKGVLLMSCDQPRLTAAHIAALVASFEAQKQDAIVASVYAEKRGVPAIFPSRCFPRLRTLSGDKGARALLVDPPCPLVEIAFEGGEIDIDSPQDLLQFESSPEP